ncbi:MAG: hypothetical protein HOP33_16850 [Verrucomicrobia bacterium]|nr:hypothetical protein [Verrucomicrobiota bacterium]
MVKPFTHPKYEALRQRSEFLATVWGVGHVFFVLFLAMALVEPLGVAMIAMIDPDLLKDRIWDFIASSVAATLLIAAIGFGVRQYAAKKGRV